MGWTSFSFSLLILLALTIGGRMNGWGWGYI